MRHSFGSVLVLVALAGCLDAEESADFVRASIVGLDTDSGVLELRINNTSRAVDACFLPLSLPSEESAAGLRVFTRTGNEIEMLDQGLPRPDAPDVVLRARENRVIRVPLTANLAAPVPAQSCIVLSAIYARCDALSGPMSGAMQEGIAADKTRELSGAWALDDGRVAGDGADCDAFLALPP